MALVSGLPHVLIFPFQPNSHEAGRGFCDPFTSFFFLFLGKRIHQDKDVLLTEEQDAFPNINTAVCKIMGFVLKCIPKPPKSSLKNKIRESI